MVLKEADLRVVAVYDCNICGGRVNTCDWCGKRFNDPDELILCGVKKHYHKECGENVEELEKVDINVCVSFLKTNYPNCNIQGYNEEAVRKCYLDTKWSEEYGFNKPKIKEVVK